MWRRQNISSEDISFEKCGKLFDLYCSHWDSMCLPEAAGQNGGISSYFLWIFLLLMTSSTNGQRHWLVLTILLTCSMEHHFLCCFKTVSIKRLFLGLGRGCKMAVTSSAFPSCCIIVTPLFFPPEPHSGFFYSCSFFYSINNWGVEAAMNNSDPDVSRERTVLVLQV